MEEPAVQQEKKDASWEQGDVGAKTDWRNECSFSSLLKHSCFLCWSSPKDTDAIEMDDRVLAKAVEIRELENVVAVENQELQEQQSDCNDLEETLMKLEKHKEKLVQQIKTTRQLCYEESQKILSLQAEEAQKESQVEEYERELARARWRLKKLRDEVKQAKGKVEKAGERNTPLQDSIRQSYEEILQEEQTLSCLSGGVVTPESQLEGSASPADTTEEDPLPLKPWGRSQSLPAYADLIMGAGDLSFCNNLAGTREEDDTESSSGKEMDRSDIEEYARDIDMGSEEDKEKEGGCAVKGAPSSQMDFYQDNPFTHCHADYELFSEDLFPKTDLSDGFTSDPFKGSNPFEADNLFEVADVAVNKEVGNVDDGGNGSLPSSENKASMGTQCFESEFPEESDVNFSDGREDFGADAQTSCTFKPIQSSSEELAPEPVQERKIQGQYSVESDPNGYELDLCPISPPSDIEEQSYGSLSGEAFIEPTGQEPGPSSPSVHHEHSEHIMEKPDWIGAMKQTLPHDSTKSTHEAKDTEEEPQNPENNQNSFDSLNLVAKLDSDQNSFDLSNEPTSQSSFDPYGFKLSPEHSSHTLLDPDEADLSPDPAENMLGFDDEASSPPLHELDLDAYGIALSACEIVRDSDPYGFKLSPEEENQVQLDLCEHDTTEEIVDFTFENNEQIENFDYFNQEVLQPQTHENQEVLKDFDGGLKKLLDFEKSENQEVLDPFSPDNMEFVSYENKEYLDLCSHENQEVVEPCLNITSQLVKEPCNGKDILQSCTHSSQDLLNFSHPENQEVPDLDSHENQELLGFECKGNQKTFISESNHRNDAQDVGTFENQELLDFRCCDSQKRLEFFSSENAAKTNNNQRIADPEYDMSSANNSSDSDQASEDLHKQTVSPANVSADKTKNTAAIEASKSNNPNSCILLEGDLGSVFRAGGYIGCPDVADDLEPLQRRPENPQIEPVRPFRPVRPARPSLRAKEKVASQGIDLK